MKNKKGILVATVVVALFAGVIFGIIAMWPKPVATNYANLDMDTVVALADKVDIGKYNADAKIEANAENGWTEERVIGDEKAPIVLFETADYACSACASWHEMLKEKIEGEYKGKVQIVYREFLRVESSVKATAAAWAAGQQGYWEAYHDILFEEQEDWLSLSGSFLQKKLEEYATKVSGGKIDMEKFREDMKSEAAAKHAAFEHRLADEQGLTGTPMFKLNGEKVEGTKLFSTLAEEIEKL